VAKGHRRRLGERGSHQVDELDSQIAILKKFHEFWSLQLMLGVSGGSATPVVTPFGSTPISAVAAAIPVTALTGDMEELARQAEIEAAAFLESLSN
jgi:hypothetical protein